MPTAYPYASLLPVGMPPKKTKKKTSVALRVLFLIVIGAVLHIAMSAMSVNKQVLQPRNLMLQPEILVAGFNNQNCRDWGLNNQNVGLTQKCRSWSRAT